METFRLRVQIIHFLARSGGGRMPLIPPLRRQLQVDLCDCEVSVLYTVSSGPASAA